MNLKNFLKTLLLLALFTVLVNGSAFAANWYVSNTNGNDVVGTGSAVSPYQTIAKALSGAADGDFIYIDADTYNEGNVSVTVAVHFVAQTFNALNTVTITNGMTINVASTKTVYLGAAADGGQKFNLGTGATALTLTAGNLSVTSSNVTIGSGGTVTVTAGTLNEALTTTNVNVTYNGTANIAAGPELPSSFGTGALTVNITAGKTLTAGSAVGFSNAGNIVVTAGNVTFNAAVTFDYSVNPGAPAITNNGVGNTVTFNGAIALNRSAGSPAISFDNNNTGTVAFVGGISNNSSANITLGLNNTSTGKVQLGASTINGTIANNAGGTVELLGAVTFSGAVVGNGNAASVFKLNSNQLTLSNAGAALTNTGNIISTTASTVGNGMLNISGAVTLTGGGELPNVTLNGQLVVPTATTIPVYGTFTHSSSTVNALDFGAAGTGVIEIWGSAFNRTDNTPTNVRAGNGTVSFRGGLAQNFTPGASLTLYNLTLNKTASTTVTLTASVNVANDLTITAGQMNVGDYNLNLTGAASTFNNSGNAYSSTGNGYVVFSGAAPTLQGTGVFGNILVSVGTGNTLSTGSSVTMSGTLYIYSGHLDVAAIGHTVTFSNDLVTNPTIKVNTTAANGAGFTNTGGGTITISANVNLYYLGANNFTAGVEWTGAPTKINDVTIATDGGTTVTGVNAASTIAGTLTVNGNTTLAQGANVYTLSGDAKTHSIVGSVTGGSLTVTGSGSAVNGTTSTTAGYNAAVNNLLFEPAANGAAFTSTNLKTIAGNLTLVGTSTKTGSSATITMNPTTSTLTGNLAVGAGAVTTASVTVAGTTTSTFTGGVTLTSGTLTLTRGGNSTVIGGGVTLTAGTLTLGSNISVTGATSQVAGNIDAGGLTYTQLGGVNYVRSGAGTFTNGTLSLNSTLGAITLTPGTTFSVPNLSSVGTANGVTLGGSMEVTNTLTLDNAATFATGANVLTVSGNTVTVTNDAGAFTGSLTLTGTSATATFAQSYAIPTLTINSTGTVTLASSSSTARTITVAAAFTNTAGTLATGINNLIIANPGTFTFTAGGITQSTGILTLNTGGAITLPATGFSIDNLTVATAANMGTSAFSVNKNLVISATITTSADGKMTLGNGCNVTRTANAATLVKLPTFGGSTNVTYSTYTGAADIVSAKELPATVNNLTVVAGANHVILNASVTVSGTLSLAAMLDATTNTKVITMADGSTLELKADGTSVLDQDLTKAGAMNLVYNGAANTTTRELGAVTSGSYATYPGAVTVKSGAVALAAKLTVGGVFTLDGGNFDINAKDFTLTNNVVTTSNGGNFVNTGAAAFIDLAGATTTFSLDADWTVPATIKLRVNKTAASDSVSLSGGNLDFSTAGVNLYLAKGVLVTGSNVVILGQGQSTLQPTQGFTKTGTSYVIGNVRKYISNSAATSIDRSVVQFPVGTPDGNYRQLDFYFKTAPQSAINLTVSAASVSPTGKNGFPITSGGLTFTNYAPFYWYVKSDIGLAPSYQYDLDAQAQGYSGYLTDQIQNVRFVRRDSGNVNNQWLLQGGSTYDNSTIAANWPVVKVIDAQGGITTQGSIFAYSQLNKAPSFTAALANKTINEKDTLSFTYTATDPDLNQVPTLSAVSIPTGATFDASTGKLTWVTNYQSAGTYNITVRASDGILSVDTTATVTVTNVNQPPAFTTVLSDTTVKSNQAFTFQYMATDSDTGQTLAYMLGSVTPAMSGTATVSSTGLLTLTPSISDVNKTFAVNVKVTDGIDTATSASANVMVNFQRKLGDVDSSGGPTPYGASLVLQYTVGLTTLSSVQMYAANVDGDSLVTAHDAAWILYAYAHHDSLPNGSVLQKQIASGEVAIGQLSNTDNSKLVSLPIKLDNTSNVYSAYIELNLNPKLVDVNKVNSSLPQGWLVSHNYQNGVLKIAMAGTTPLTDGNLAVLGLIMKDKSAKFDLSGKIQLNNAPAVELNTVTVKQIPSQFELSQNYPNPFNPTTTIKYQIAQDTRVTLEVFNMLGQKIATLVNGTQSAGYYNISWNGMNSFGQQVSSGVYIYRLHAGSFVKTLKMNLLK